MKSKKKLVIILLLTGISFAFLIKAEDLEKKCALKNVDKECEKISPSQCQALLNECLNYYQEQAKHYEKEVEETQKKRKSLQSEIRYLESKIKKLKNEIYHNELVIKDLRLQIQDTEKSIEQTSQKIEETKEKIAQILRLINEYEQKSIIEILLEEETLSGFFDELAALESLSYQHQKLLKNIKDLKTDLEKQKEALLQDKEDLEQAVLISSLKAKESKKIKEEKDWLLKKTKGQERKYKEYLKEVEKKASEIRKRIFELAQVAETEAPSYEEAYDLAKSVGALTGVRPALILGLLEVESAIGKNVGQCNCQGKVYCRHPEISWKEVMPKSHWDAFLRITKELGLDPNKTPVSCAVNGGKVQWGGAMGPAQFMPNTWLNLGYKERVEKITGVKPANPWRVKDAFLAAALYLKDFGADSQKLKNEIGAVTAYLCGSPYMTRRCIRAGGRGYRSLVMEKASKWQQWIDEGVFEK
jgi:peptidoglycan hydrolase CwlO-like protein